MALRLPKSLVLPCLGLSVVLSSCDRDITSSEDQPTVDYVLLVTDSVTSGPIADVKVRVTTIAGDTSTYFTDALEGRAELETVASSRTLFVLSKPGYRTLDILDTVNSKPDSIFNRPVQRLLRIRMASLTGDSGRVQAQILVRDTEDRRLKRGRATFVDSLGVERVVADPDTNGILELSGLEIGKTRVRVEHSGRLGRLIEVAIDKADTGRRAPSFTAVLAGLDNKISGQVYQKTAVSSLELRDAKVEFRLKDSLSYPARFTAYTSAEVGQGGRFEFVDVPAADGELWFFKDRTSRERVKALPVTREEVLLDGPLPLVTLTIPADSLLPFLTAGPGKSLPGNDTVAAGDSLVFRFNQQVKDFQAKVSLINASELLIAAALGEDRKSLVVRQKEAAWLEGKRYEYSISAFNAAGQAFTVPGDTTPGIRGSFAVRVKSSSEDSVKLPHAFQFAYFNSGSHYAFGPEDAATSPLADSSSQFARLKWNWKGGGQRVDSIVVYYKDGAGTKNFTRWGAIPGFLDSANIVFSDGYSTTQVPSQSKARFPLKDANGEIFFQLVPKHRGMELDAGDTTLPGLAQGMGPTVYAQFQAGGSKDSVNSVDSLKVWFLENPADATQKKAWGAAGIRPVPKLYFDGQLADTTMLKWRWIEPDAKEAHLVYQLGGTINRAPQLRVDLNGVMYRGRPIWHRNRELIREIRK